MQSAMASTERIFEFMDHREIIPEPDSPERPQTIEGRPLRMSPSLTRLMALKGIYYKLNQLQMEADS
ncbi:MAG: hypothetical protein ABII06_11425 [Pseudomonadota bacterium]